MKWQTKFWIITICVLAVFVNVMAFGTTDDSGCEYDNPWVTAHHSILCYVAKIYQQNQVIEKQNEQTNQLLSMIVCDKWEKDYSPIGQAQLNKLGLNECTNKLVNMTK